MRHPLLATRLYNTPLLIEPHKAAVIERIFRRFEFAEHPSADLSSIEQDLSRRASRPGAMDDDEPVNRGPERTESASLGKLVRRPEKQYDMTATGIAVIPAVGTLVQRTGGMQPFSGMVPYAYIGRKLEAALADHEVKAVLLEIDSYGGEVNGCFELAEQIIKARAIKPVWAHANEAAYSAGYALACAASKLYLPNTAGVGSVGVIALHVDESKYDARVGLAYTYIYAGARKKDGNSHEPLSERARTDVQDEIDRLYGIFVAHVAAARGLDPENVIATEAASINPDQALKFEFADGVLTFDETVQALEAGISKTNQIYFLPGAGSSAQQPGKEKSMSNVKQADTQFTAEQETVIAARVDAAVNAARAEERKAERERFQGILKHAEAADRGTLALSLALDSDMSVEQAGKILAAASKQQGNALSSLMGKLSNPKVGVDADNLPETGMAVINAADIYAARQAHHQKH